MSTIVLQHSMSNLFLLKELKYFDRVAFPIFDRVMGCQDHVQVCVVYTIPQELLFHVWNMYSMRAFGGIAFLFVNGRIR